MSTPAKTVDVLKIHDFRYIEKVKSRVQLAEENDVFVKFDNDSTISAETWKAALLSTGAVIEACDKIMSP